MALRMMKMLYKQLGQATAIGACPNCFLSIFLKFLSKNDIDESLDENLSIKPP
jgi:lipoprotein